MALFVCPECSNKVSDKSKVCIYCGYPIQEHMAQANNEPSDTGFNICPACGWIFFKRTNCKDCGQQMVNAHCQRGEYYQMLENNTLDKWKEKVRKQYTESSPVFNAQLYTQRIQKEQSDNAQWEQAKRNAQSVIKVGCPYCKSTNTVKISGTEKVVNIALFGIFGNRRKYQWHCNNCGSDF